VLFLGGEEEESAVNEVVIAMEVAMVVRQQSNDNLALLLSSFLRGFFGVTQDEWRRRGSGKELK
jgi:hypothetical protein